MIQANELRIGNYISYDKIEKLPTIVEGIYFDEEYERQSIICRHVEDFINEFEPIPLTEEWLLKFGFVKFIELQVYQLQGFEIAFEKGFFWYMLDTRGEIQVTYLHDLQNLYFAITKTELTIDIN